MNRPTDGRTKGQRLLELRVCNLKEKERQRERKKETKMKEKQKKKERQNKRKRKNQSGLGNISNLIPYKSHFEKV